MIVCVTCNQWLHCSCLGMSYKDAKKKSLPFYANNANKQNNEDIEHQNTKVLVYCDLKVWLYRWFSLF